jgi:hypothetical protein
MSPLARRTLRLPSRRSARPSRSVATRAEPSDGGIRSPRLSPPRSAVASPKPRRRGTTTRRAAREPRRRERRIPDAEPGSARRSRAKARRPRSIRRSASRPPERPPESSGGTPALRCWGFARQSTFIHIAQTAAPTKNHRTGSGAPLRARTYRQLLYRRRDPPQPLARTSPRMRLRKPFHRVGRARKGRRMRERDTGATIGCRGRARYSSSRL